MLCLVYKVKHSNVHEKLQVVQVLMVKNPAVIMVAAVVVIIIETLASYKLTGTETMMQIQHQSRQVEIMHHHIQNTIICKQLTLRILQQCKNLKLSGMIMTNITENDR